MKDDQIIYPDLVEQSYRFMRSKGVNVTKDMIYRKLVKFKMIDQNGQPTKKAIKEGLISETDDPNSLAFFKAQNPLFLPYDDTHFTWVDELHGWATDLYVAEDVAKRILNGQAIGDKEHAKAVLAYVKRQAGDQHESTD